MTARELVVLGTASQVPTRTRNANGYLLRWDGEGILFDPGEGTQRQLTLAGVPAAAVTRICITHLHGDHCLGLPGIVQRLALDGVDRTVHLYFPASAVDYVHRLLTSSITGRRIDLELHPVNTGMRLEPVDDVGAGTLFAARLEHGVEAVGWRLAEPHGRRLLPERLAAAGLYGPVVGRLQREGVVDVDGRTVRLEQVSEPRAGQVVGFVMDTRECAGAEAIAERADLLVCESTFRTPDAALAYDYGHLTAAQAARLASGGHARRLVLTHFSQRYADPSGWAAEAAPLFDDVVVAADLDRVPVPPRARPA
jgi:ribonuclease Z